MDFTDLFQQSNHLCKFSPDGKYIASCSQHRMVIRDSESLQISSLQTCLDPVQQLEWSPDSKFVMCSMFRRGIVQIWSLEHPEWTCKIDEGSAGLVAARWAPDSRHVLTTADFQLRVTLWSLVSKTVAYIRHPKLACGGLEFSRDGRFMVLAERRDCKDYVSIFDCASWQLCKHFPVETEDLAGVSWSPDGRALCVWEASVQYAVAIYSLDGRRLGSYSAYRHALGAKCVSWSPSSQFLAVGSYDQRLRVLNHVTWRVVVEWDHPTTVDHSSAVVFCEVERKTPAIPSTDKFLQSLRAQVPLPQSKYETKEVPVQIATLKPDPEKPNPKMGVGTALFSPDSRYLATLNDNMPSVVWIWDIQKLQLSAVLVQTGSVKAVAWNPLQSQLAVCTGASKLYVWSPAGCINVSVPAGASFAVTGLAWHPDGSAVMLMSKTQFCVCYLSGGAS